MTRKERMAKTMADLEKKYNAYTPKSDAEFAETPDRHRFIFTEKDDEGGYTYETPSHGEWQVTELEYGVQFVGYDGETSIVAVWTTGQNAFAHVQVTKCSVDFTFKSRHEICRSRYLENTLRDLVADVLTR